jgi:hypothetical protein
MLLPETTLVHSHPFRTFDAQPKLPGVMMGKPCTAPAGLLARAGDVDAACQAYQLAIGLESDPAVRDFLQRRSAELRVAMSVLKMRRPTDKKTLRQSPNRSGRRAIVPTFE